MCGSHVAGMHEHSTHLYMMLPAVLSEVVGYQHLSGMHASVVNLGTLLQNILPAKTYNAAKTLALTAGVVGLGIVMVLLTGYVMASPTFGWTGASLLC